MSNFSGGWWSGGQRPGPWHSGNTPSGPWAFDSAPTAAPASYDSLHAAGMVTAGAGVALDIANTYYGLKAQQGQLETEAMNAAFAANQANMQARAAERDAETIIRAGQQEAAWRGAQAGADVASFRADAAARGVVVGSGSAGDVERAIRVASEVDRRTIRTNAERRASATREAAANARVSSILGRASAANMRATANSINPAVGAVGRGLSGAGSLIGQHLAYTGRR